MLSKEEAITITDTVMDYCQNKQIGMSVQMNILCDEDIAKKIYKIIKKNPDITKKQFLKRLVREGIDIDE